MTKKQKIIYWFFTCWLALGMVSTAIVQLLRKPEEVGNFSSLGYPVYLMTVISWYSRPADRKTVPGKTING